MRLNNTYLLFRKKNLLFWLTFPLLYLLSFIYCLIVEFLKFSYEKGMFFSYRPKFKVISVGNITLGGTGKTPFVEWLTTYLIEQNKNPGIIIRGYKKPKTKCDGTAQGDNYFGLGDEASMLKKNLKGVNICVGPDKIKSVRQLEKKNCDMAILDDGFQHWRLKRDLDIVTIDSTFPILDQYLLPLGRLREPLNSLKRADIFVLTKTDLMPDNSMQLKRELSRINSQALIVSSIYEPTCFLNLNTGDCIKIDSLEFRNKPVFILVGIANPLYFDKLISNLGLKIEREFIYPDHYEYKLKDISRIKELALNLKIDTIITTQKDAERLSRLLDFLKPINILGLKVQLKITENEQELSHRLLSLLNS